MDSSHAPTRKNSSLLANEPIHWAIAVALMVMAALLAAHLKTSPLGAALLVATGALAGYLTTDVAITLLFWPTKPRVGGIVYGAFYKRRNELGDALINMAVQRFLNPELFRKLIQDKAVEQALHDSVFNALQDLGQQELGTARSVLAKFIPDHDTQEEIFERIDTFVGNHIGNLILKRAIHKEHVSMWLGSFVDRLGNADLARLVQDRQSVARTVAKAVTDFLRGSSGRQTGKWIAGAVDGALTSEKRLVDILPAQTRRRIDDLAMEYLKEVAIREPTRLLRDPAVRAKAAAMVRDEVERLTNTRISEMQGLKGWLIRTFGGRDIRQVIDDTPKSVERFLERLAESLPQRELQDYLGNAMKRVLAQVWEVQIHQLKKWLPPRMIEHLVDAAFKELSSPDAVKGITDHVSKWLADFNNMQLKAVLPGVFTPGPERDKALEALAGMITGVAGEAKNQRELRTQCRIMTRKVVVSFLDTPIPKLSELPFVNKQMLDELATQTGNLTVTKLRDVGPTLVEHFPIQRRLQELWESLTNEQIQDSVERVLSTEFKILINLGISFGAVVAGLLLLCDLAMVGMGLDTIVRPLGEAGICLALVAGYKLFKRRIAQANSAASPSSPVRPKPASSSET